MQLGTIHNAAIPLGGINQGGSLQVFCVHGGGDVRDDQGRRGWRFMGRRTGFIGRKKGGVPMRGIEPKQCKTPDGRRRGVVGVGVR